MDFKKTRTDYGKKTLVESRCPEKPHLLLDSWLRHAHMHVSDANAFTLSTVNAQGYPTSRIVLLRELDERGISFFTNYQSQKGGDMEAHPNVSINFFWSQLERQVRIEGEVEKLSASESDAYFNSRPRASQIGAWASAQSQVLSSRDELELKVESLKQKFEGKEIPRPDFWGGYLVRPTKFEFWQGRPSRLHDRIQYEQEKSHWIIKRLSP